MNLRARKIIFIVLFFREGTELDFSKTTESLLNRGKSADIILASPIQNLLEKHRKGKKPLDGRKWLLPLFFFTHWSILVSKSAQKP